MKLTIEITDEQLDELKSALRVRSDLFQRFMTAPGIDLLIDKSEATDYGERILRARRALGLFCSWDSAVINPNEKI